MLNRITNLQESIAAALLATVVIVGAGNAAAQDPNAPAASLAAPDSRTGAEANPEPIEAAKSQIPENLADALAIALANNPDIAMAEAKVAEAAAALQTAQAALRQTKLKVTQDVTGTFELRKFLLELQKNGHGEIADIKELAKVEASLPNLMGLDRESRAPSAKGVGVADPRQGAIGKGAIIGDFDPDGQQDIFIANGRSWRVFQNPSESVPAPDGAGQAIRGQRLPDDVRAALTENVDIKIEVGDDLATKISETVGQALVDRQVIFSDIMVGQDSTSFEFNGETTLLAAMKLFRDFYGVQFLLRDYGVVVARDVGVQLPGMSLADLEITDL